MLDHTRRDFLLRATLVSAAGLAARRMPAEEPFDSLPSSLWRNARQNGLVMIHRPAPTQLSWRTQIAGNDEPGDRLVVAGQVFAPDGHTPAASVTVYAYNTDTQGYYGEHHTEYPPRLYGWMRTDAAGRFELRTVRPGSYPGMQVPAHIHFVLWGAGYPLQWVDELRFEGDKYLTTEIVAADVQRGEFRTIRPVLDGGDGAGHCDFKIKLQREGNFR